MSRMKRIPLYVALVAIACTGNESEDSVPDAAGGETDTDADTDADADTGTDPNLANVSGTITVPGGGPADHYRVNVCRDICLTVPSDSSGNFQLVELDPAVWSFYVLPYGDSDYSVPYGPITLVAGETHTQNVELVPNAGSVTLKKGSPATVGTFGTLTVTTAFETSLGDAVDTLTYTDALTPQQSVGDTINGESVETMVYLGTFEAEGSAVLNLARNDVAPGSTRNVYVAELPETSGWTLAGSVVAQGDGEMMMGDIVISHLTTVAVTIPAE